MQPLLDNPRDPQVNLNPLTPSRIPCDSVGACVISTDRVLFYTHSVVCRQKAAAAPTLVLPVPAGKSSHTHAVRIDKFTTASTTTLSHVERDRQKPRALWLDPYCVPLLHLWCLQQFVCLGTTGLCLL